MGGGMKTKEVYLYSDEISQELFEQIEKELGCQEATNSLFDKDPKFGCLAHTTESCKTPKDIVYIIKLQVVDHEHTRDETMCECCG